MKKRTAVILAIILVICAFAGYLIVGASDITSEDLQEVQITDDEFNQTQQQIEGTESIKLTGKVLDGMTNQPLAAKITLKNIDRIVNTTECSASGEYILPVEDGNYQVYAEYPGYVSKGKNDIYNEIEIEGESVENEPIKLWPEAKVKGRIVSDNQGIGAEIRFSYQKDDSNARLYFFDTIKADESGQFLLNHAYGGVQDIEIIADGFVTQNLTDVELKPGNTVDLGDIPMQPGVTIFGVVTDEASNKAVANATIKFVDFNRKKVIQTKSLADGSYILPATAMNRLKIFISGDNFENFSSIIQTNGQNRYEFNVILSKISDMPVIAHESAKQGSTDNSENIAENLQKPFEPDPEIEAAAEKRFQENEQLYQSVLAIQIGGDVPDNMPTDQYIDQQVNLKLAAMQNALLKYNESMKEYDSPNWETASLARMGMMMQEIAEDEMSAQIPEDLSEENKIKYQNLLNDHAIQFMEKGIRYYESAIRKSEENNISNEYVLEAQKRLFGLRY